MTRPTALLMAATLALLAAVHVRAATQGQPPPPPSGVAAVQGGAGAPQGRGGNSFPQQQRPLADAATLARGKGLYDISCSACHGVDLRGGQLGGPNLLRSQNVLDDKAGELIGPIIIGGRPNSPAGSPVMPPFPLPDADVKAIAEYLHSVAAQGGRQGRPPEDDIVKPERVLVGDPAAGQTYFAVTCGTCHSAVGDLRGIGSRVADPRELQNCWVSGGGGGGRGRGAAASGRATVKVTPAGGQTVEGRLVRIDDFLVTLIGADGTRRTMPRNGPDPKVEIDNPGDAHRKLVMTLADKDMHNVTAYLWTVK